MEKIEVRILSSQAHNSQILTGFWLLNQSGEYSVNIIDYRTHNKEYNNLAFVEAVYKDKIIIYDTLDGYHRLDAMKYYLEKCDFYFKRSFSDELNSRFFPDYCDKIFPLGMNCYVTYPGNPLEESGIRKFFKLISGMKPHSYFTYDKFEQIPRYNPNPTIMFYTRLWTERNELSEDERLEIKKINKTRIEIIRQLNKQYGNRFLGGLFDEPTARQLAPDLILDRRKTNRENYIKQMKKSDICIASTGLHGSIGWKTAEYVAAARAIVSEKHIYKVPGDFQIGSNYLEFHELSDCINKINSLIQSPSKIYNMQIENHMYYLRYLTPEILVRNSLVTVHQCH